MKLIGEQKFSFTSMNNVLNAYPLTKSRLWPVSFVYALRNDFKEDFIVLYVGGGEKL